MAFRAVNFKHLAKFNSANSSDFIDFYEKYVDSQIADKMSRPASQTFAPSSFRCSRKCWFRLRGVQPDTVKSVDRVLNFSADIGTACHRIIQSNLRDSLGEDWISVRDYLSEHPIPYSYTLEEDELETKVCIDDPPFRFACDGIIRWKGEYYLLEIKTSEYSSFEELTDPKPMHVDQIRCYATLLGIDNVLVLYQDRQYGNLKCYEMKVTDVDRFMVLDKVQHIQYMVDSNLAPERLPSGDYWCGHCEYREKCKEWG